MGTKSRYYNVVVIISKKIQFQKINELSSSQLSVENLYL